LTGFYLVLLGLTWVLLSFTGFYLVFQYRLVLVGVLFFGEVCRGVRWFSWVSWGFTGFYRVLPGFTGFSWALLRSSWVLLGFNGFDRV